MFFMIFISFHLFVRLTAIDTILLPFAKFFKSFNNIESIAQDFRKRYNREDDGGIVGAVSYTHLTLPTKA